MRFRLPRRRATRVLRHVAAERTWQPVTGDDPGTGEAVDRHVGRHFGPASQVWHDPDPAGVHVDVQVVRPTPARPFLTLVTSGMSRRAMTVHPDADSNPYCELMLGLPADWPTDPATACDESAYWPVRLLQTVARLPHEYRTWIGPWHSMPNGDPARPYAPDTPFVGVMVTPMLLAEPAAHTITTEAGREIALLALVPLHRRELDHKVRRGSDALADALDRGAVTELLDPARPSTV